MSETDPNAFELTDEEKRDAVRSSRPAESNIPQAKSYSGLGRNPESNIPQAKSYSGLGRNPESNIPQAKGGFSQNTITSKTDAVKAPLFIDNAPAPQDSKKGSKGPFTLSVTGLTWKVSAFGSSITDGVNGDELLIAALGLFDVDNVIASSKWIVAEADVAVGVATGWVFSAVDEADAVEISFDAATPPAQEKVRGLIGKVNVASGKASAVQGLFTPLELTHVFVNGTIVLGLIPAKTNPASL